MEKIINTIIITTASILASILFIIGVRKVKIKEYKKYGLFISTFLIALGLSGCDILKQTDRNTTSNIESNKSQNIDELQNTNIQSERISLLNSTDEWKAYKIFWQQLDGITPKDGVDTMDPYYGDYWQAISYDKADGLRAELKIFSNSLRDMKQEETILSNTEIDLLASVCAARIDYMSSGFSSMTMRMIPPLTMTDKEDSIKDLEKRIDILIELKISKKINENEFQQALAIIKEDIGAFSILEAITEHYVYYYSNRVDGDRKVPPDMDTVEQHINDFEQHYIKYLKRRKEGNINGSEYEYLEDLDKKYEETKTAIKQVKAALPSLNELINDLERYD